MITTNVSGAANPHEIVVYHPCPRLRWCEQVASDFREFFSLQLWDVPKNLLALFIYVFTTEQAPLKIACNAILPAKIANFFEWQCIRPHLFLYHLAKEKRNDWRHYSFIHSFLSFFLPLFPRDIKDEKRNEGKRNKHVKNVKRLAGEAEKSYLCK